MFNFEKLDVWQEAIRFADLVYELTSNFPDQERFGLTNQMRRAAVSISSNLAEGSSRVSRTDFARFVEIATGSFIRGRFTIHDRASAKDDRAKQIHSDLRGSGKAEQDAQRITQIIIGGVAPNLQPSAKTPQPSATLARRQGRRGEVEQRQAPELVWAAFRLALFCRAATA
jgi:hypothetical protein